MKREDILEEREWRRAQANEFIEKISSVGRKFFRHGDRTSRFEMHKGKLWFRDCYSQKLIYLHSPRSKWKGFTQGGTLRVLVRHLKEFIWEGTLVPAGIFGPWPDWYCRGDLWEYGEEAMENVRLNARGLGICKLK